MTDGATQFHIAEKDMGTGFRTGQIVNPVERGHIAFRTDDIAAFKETYGLSRKFAIPLLEWLDRERVTKRAGEKRVVLRPGVHGLLCRPGLHSHTGPDTAPAAFGRAASAPNTTKASNGRRRRATTATITGGQYGVPVWPNRPSR